MGRRLALLIATYEYQDDGLRALTAPAHDAEALSAVLKDPDIAGFEVTTLINEPNHRVGEAIADLYRDRRRDDLTLLYFTGHGLKDDDGRLYLAMTNTRRSSLLFTSLSAEQIDQAMSDCMSRQKVLILDCCYSGAFPAGRLAKADTDVHTLERFQGRGRTVLTASDATQYSFEGSQRRGTAAQSVFTRHLVAGLRDGSADLDGDGDITLDELYSYVYDRVVDEMPQQRPKKQDNVEGRMVIARNINWSLPTHLRHALSSPIPTDRLGALDGLARLHRIGNDLVRQRALDEIQRLMDDDSRTVSAAAAHFQPLLPPAPESAPPAASETRQAVEEQAAPPGPRPVTSEVQPSAAAALTSEKQSGVRGADGPAALVVPVAALEPVPWHRIVVGVPGPEFEARPPGQYSFDFPDTECDGWSTSALVLRSASVRGDKHRYYQQPRQDAARAAVCGPTGSIVFAVADGSSRAAESAHGAVEACRASVEKMLHQLSQDQGQLDFQDVARHAAERLSQLTQWRLSGKVPERSDVMRLYATTLVAGVVRPHPAGPVVEVCSIGDSGAWVLDSSSGQYQPLFGAKTASDALVASNEAMTLLPNVPDPLKHTSTRLTSHHALLIGTAGFADPLGDGHGQVGALFAKYLAAPPPPVWFGHLLDFSRETFDDDRTLLAIWPHTTAEPR
ncbi:protein phosphatase 2C domain-containing protein [Streptomyces sp. NPDC059697]|uniref:caspase, EACC1-associated type n=1 Tax=Streptomyces sp. NPDC059697 TaxID=3346912 RepID=UPI0036BC12B7